MSYAFFFGRKEVCYGRGDGGTATLIVLAVYIITFSNSSIVRVDQSLLTPYQMAYFSHVQTESTCRQQTYR